MEKSNKTATILGESTLIINLDPDKFAKGQSEEGLFKMIETASILEIHKPFYINLE